MDARGGKRGKMNREQRQLFCRLGKYRGKISREILLTIRAQILRGDIIGAARGLDRIERRVHDYGEKERF